jgi:hypothetical protein
MKSALMAGRKIVDYASDETAGRSSQMPDARKNRSKENTFRLWLL